MIFHKKKINQDKLKWISILKKFNNCKILEKEQVNLILFKKEEKFLMGSIKIINLQRVIKKGKFYLSFV